MSVIVLLSMGELEEVCVVGTECVKGCGVDVVGNGVFAIELLSMREVEEECVSGAECVEGCVSWLGSGKG